ncbi:MAG: hypothetical protein OXU20_07545 [Myxococcales bacterium]|nr:hypothetical protein [Myxococcales bacterium]MDD9966518.1 hypothetical protein [Myxococcales bacterium]
MTEIEAVEKRLPPKRRALLLALRDSDWKVRTVTRDVVEWWHDEIWCIASTRENYGFTLHLWFNSHSGKYDGLDNVIAWPDVTLSEAGPDPYGSEPRLDFDSPRFSANLAAFIDTLHRRRLRGA